MKLNTFTDYGLRVLMYLATRPAHLASVKEISDHFDISRHHLVKVALRLSHLGHVYASRGKGGGMRLADSALDARLGDLVSQLEADMNLVECFDSESNTCRIVASCKLKHMLYDARTAFLKELNQFTLREAATPSPFQPASH
ncbi:MAG: BadM/Rrf2 family transcriptional regulator [Asticcacaulis sp. 32-58-5]|nr:MAG: BadM/Rrf2 family transcriptional regulator [Asticcacaulis sp. 32-58-5]